MWGMATLDGDKVAEIVEKPEKPKSSWAQVGAYILDKNAFGVIAGLKPSARGQYEITDVTGHYVKLGTCKAIKIQGWWSDVGTHEALAEATAALYEKKHGKGSLNAALERRFYENV